MFVFAYRLNGPGWSEARLATEDGEVLLTASSLSDALRALLEAVALVVEGGSEGRCSWDDEPGEYRWVLRRLGDEVEIRVLQFGDLWSEHPDEAGREVFRTRQSPVRVGRAVLSAAGRVLDEHGAEGYARQWGRHQFPDQAVERLRRAIQAVGSADQVSPAGRDPRPSTGQA